MNPKDENKVIESGKPNEVSKNPWECRVSKRTEEVQRKKMGQECPSGKWDTGACKQCKKKLNEHTESLGRK